MKKTLSIITSLFILNLFTSCLSIPSEPTKEVAKEPPKYFPDERVVEKKDLSSDDIEIYSFFITVLLQKYNTRSTYVYNKNGTYTLKEMHTPKIAVKSKTYSIVSSKETYEDDYAGNKAFFESKFGTIYSSAFDSFIEKNKSFNDLTNFLSKNKKVLNFDTLEFDQDDYWTSLYENYPELCGRAIFSNIGYNDDKTIAVMELEFCSNFMSGYVNYFVLEKNKTWAVKEVLVRRQY